MATLIMEVSRMNNWATIIWMAATDELRGGSGNDVLPGDVATKVIPHGDDYLNGGEAAISMAGSICTTAQIQSLNSV